VIGPCSGVRAVPFEGRKDHIPQLSVDVICQSSLYPGAPPVPMVNDPVTVL